MSPIVSRLAIAFLALLLPVIAACDSSNPYICENDFPLTMVSDEPGNSSQTANTGSTVVVHYRGTLDDGTVFDSTRAGSPACLPLPRMIAGFRLGVGGVTIQGDDGDTVIPPMKFGGRRTLRIPPNLGYRTEAREGIPSCSALNFEIELIETSNGC